MTSLNRHGEDIPDPGGDAGTWDTILNSVLQFFDQHTWITKTVTSDYTPSNYEFIAVDASGNAVDVTLPPPESDLVVAVKAINTNNSVTISTPNAETIDGASSLSLALTDSVRFIHSDGTDYQLATPQEGTLDHDSLSGFVSDEHVAHNNVSINGGNGITGGGNIATSQTLNAHQIRTVSSDATAGVNEYLLVDASGGNRTITLPSPSTDIDCLIKKISDAGNTVTVTPPGAETVDGQNSLTLNNAYVLEGVISDGTDYYLTR